MLLLPLLSITCALVPWKANALVPTTLLCSAAAQLAQPAAERGITHCLLLVLCLEAVQDAHNAGCWLCVPQP